VRLLGIEWANKFYRHAADRMARWKLTNVRVMRTEARQFVVRNLPAACVSVLHLYHPDPWPKRKHHKRRLVDAAFVEAVAKTLIPGGRWRIQTDHLEYFEVIVRLVNDQPLLAKSLWEGDGAAFAEEWPGTNFEIKYSREGRAIHRAAFQKRQRDEASTLSIAGVNRSEILAE
jgi:tRNA (guanine-N7-)-methyltransferase